MTSSQRIVGRRGRDVAAAATPPKTATPIASALRTRMRRMLRLLVFPRNVRDGGVDRTVERVRRHLIGSSFRRRLDLLLGRNGGDRFLGSLVLSRSASLVLGRRGSLGVLGRAQLLLRRQ